MRAAMQVVMVQRKLQVVNTNCTRCVNHGCDGYQGVIRMISPTVWTVVSDKLNSAMKTTETCPSADPAKVVSIPPLAHISALSTGLETYASMTVCASSLASTEPSELKQANCKFHPLDVEPVV